MTLNKFMEAVALKLTALWPERLVHVDDIPQDADGHFFVGIIDSEQAKLLGRRKKRGIQFEVLYFLKSKDTMSFNDWVESMYDNFETLVVQEDDAKTRTIRLTNQSAKKNNNAHAFQFLFDADFQFVESAPPDDPMESVTHTEVLKQ